MGPTHQLCFTCEGGCAFVHKEGQGLQISGQWRPRELQGQSRQASWASRVPPCEETGRSPGKVSLELQDLDKGPGKLREPY